MKCSQASPLTETEISMLLDGEQDQRLLAHIEHCEYCARRLHEARLMEVEIRQRLDRMECPEIEELGELHMNLLSEQRTEELRDHVKTCSKCQEDLELLIQYLDEDDGVTTIGQENAKVISPPRDYFIPELVDTPLNAVRGKSGKQVRARVEGVDLLIDIQLSAKGLTITGTLMQDDAFDSWSNSIMQLRQAGNIVKISPLDELSMFYCEGIDPGNYALRITAEDGRIIEIPEIKINLDF